MPAGAVPSREEARSAWRDPLATNPSVTLDGDSGVRDRIIAVARQCFAKYGPRRTTMEDIAAAAGIARPALYRYVSSRDEIIERVIIERVEELGETLRPLFEESTSFSDGFVQVSLAAINAARLDPELQALFETTTGSRIVQVMGGPSTGPQSHFLSGCSSSGVPH